MKNNITLKHKNKPMIILDSDSVLLDWCKSFFLFLNNKSYCTKHVEHFLGTTQFVTTQEIIKSDCKNEINSLMNEFSNSDYLSQLSIFQDNAKDIIKELSENYNIVVLTCIGITDDIIKKRCYNLIDIYGDVFSGIICLDYGTSKEDYLKSLNKNFDVKTFVDDRFKHIEEATRAGIKPILYSRGVDDGYSSNDEYLVMDCWSKINDYLKK